MADTPAEKTETKKVEKANDAAATPALKAGDAGEPGKNTPIVGDPAAGAGATPAHAPTVPPGPTPHTAQDVVGRLADKLDDLQSKIRPTGPAGPTVGLDVAPKGGRFIVRGKLVDAHDRELNEDGSLKHPEQVKIDAYGRPV